MISIPSKLANLLNGLTDEISAAVGLCMSTVGPILERNAALFFPDYTDHGVKHVESVLKTCELMASEEAWKSFTREDVAVLIIAVMTHDLGMLIDADGFRYLINPTNEIEPLMEKDEPWQKLWRDFQLDARRFDGPTLINILGTPDPVTMQELDSNKLTERSLKIIGEFLRRHHHRLAHEIIMYGMPSENKMVPLFDGVPSYLKDIAGRVARSHGISIRECIESFAHMDRNAHRACHHTHPTFLMTLVRLADYLDLDESRASSSIIATKTLRSPISKREWWSHRAMMDCHSHDDDPECLYLVVEPSAIPDVLTLSIIEEKLIGIQQEFDCCWAVLGEVYGRFPPLNQLSLKIRRVRSDIREDSKISQLPFVPYRASLESTRADLLKLLIEPLYGDNPGIGVRELVQNAIDAVREFDFIIKDMPASMLIDREALESDVVVTFEKDGKGYFWVVIADRGIGMTWQTVCKYYLTAGASFRQSGAWKKRFTDDSGESQVLRSGRFGIGVLAAFLLGDRIKVSTRHVEEAADKGIEFEFGLDDATIQLCWKKRKVGTTVKVRTTEQVVKKLMERKYYAAPQNWDWYYLDKPELLVRNQNGTKITSKYNLPGFEGPLPADWHSIKVPGLQAVNWTYRKDAPYLTCNGILIEHSGINCINLIKHFAFGPAPFSHLRLADPRVSVFDPDGQLPLNLARDGLARRHIELERLLADDLSRNFIAYCLYKGPTDRLLSENHFSAYVNTGYPGNDDHYLMTNPSWYFDTRNGFGLSDPWNIAYFSSTPGLLMRIIGNFQIPNGVADVAKDYGFILGIQSDTTFYRFDSWMKSLVLSLYYEDAALPIFKGLKIKGFQVLMSTMWYERFRNKQPQYVTNKHQGKRRLKNWAIFTVGDCPDNEDRLLSLAEKLENNITNIESVTECFFSPPEEVPEPGQIAKIWKEAVGGPIIPFSIVDRQHIIESLNDKFKKHLDEWSREPIRRRIRR